MITIRGNYAEAIIYADAVEPEARRQVQELCDQPFAADSHIRIMPDAHPGKGCVIGLTMTYTGKIVPNLVGVDIGCGIRTIRIAEKTFDPERLDRIIRQNIPSGFNIRKAPHALVERVNLDQLHALARIDRSRAERSIGTLGGGNHFIEVAKADDELYLLIHSGSRHLGKQTAEHYQNLAIRGSGPPRHLAYVEGEALGQYVDDVKIVQEYAAVNRLAMAETILSHMGWTEVDAFETVHNYVDTKDRIIRKGAVSAGQGQRLIVPINMRDGSLLCVGKGNAEWNFSAPHGAGRVMSRGAARKSITMAQYEKSMEGIFSTAVSHATIDEAPFAYKPMQEIVAHIGPAATLLAVIKPVYNFKAA